MRVPIVHIVPALPLVASVRVGAAAESYQPTSNVTRGIYAHIHTVTNASVWDRWGGGFAFVGDRPHGGKACVQCVGQAGTRGQGVGQVVQLDQAEARPVKIAGWSRSQQRDAHGQGRADALRRRRRPHDPHGGHGRPGDADSSPAHGRSPRA